jgi:hypothetical protein
MQSLARALLLLLLVAGSAARADEGMWTPDNFPKALVKQKLGVDVTDAWLEKVRLATTRISGCTGSFISPDGLMVTNDHCSWGCLAQLSTPDSDLLGDGFLARTRAEERRCPTQQASILVGIEDMTTKIATATAGLDDQAANAANKKELTRLEEACETASKRDKKLGELSCEAVTLYNGGQYFIYKYKRYEDVRLVFAPEFAIAAFGGDPDNFQFPRWCLDMSILRVYHDGKPLATPNHLKVNWNGPAAGQPVFVSGHPGSTDRLLSVEELRTLRNTHFPFLLMRHSELRGRYIQFAKTGPEPQRIVKDKLDSLENSIKVYRKEFDALLTDELMATKMAKENALRQAANADPALRSLVGNAWDDLAKAQAIYRDMLVEYNFIEKNTGFNSALYTHARNLVRGTAERAKPNAERLREYTDAAIPKLEQGLKAQTPVYPELEKLTLSYSLERMREWLGPDAPIVRGVLGSESPDSLAASLVDGSKLADPEVRMQLWNGGVAAVEASTDPMIVLARKVDPAARALRKRYEDQVEAHTLTASERIARARFKVEGTSTYPDATFTLRINFGTVQGWVEKGEPIPPFTQLGRLYERATGKDPFRVPESWMQAKAQLDPATPFNLSTNSDIVGGNSGSPLIDAKGDLVGLMFDGNIHSIAGSYWFDPEKNRAVAVHPAIIREALTKVYRADELYREISGGK